MPTLRGSSAALESFQTPPAPLPRAREEPLPHRPPGAGKPMMRRVLVIALAAAAVFAAILGAASPAQDPVATSSPESTPTVIAPAPAESAAPEVTTAAGRDPRRDAHAGAGRDRHAGADRRRPRPGRLARADRDRLPGPRGHGHRHGGQPPEPAAGPAKGITRKSPTKKSNTRTRSSRSRSAQPRLQVETARPSETDRDDQHEVVKVEAPTLTTSTGTPAPTNPSYSLATPGRLRSACRTSSSTSSGSRPSCSRSTRPPASQYGVRWEVLAAINEIETDYGRNLNVSSAGALGWMQFMPATWKQYGVDANRRRRQGPVQPGRRDLRRRALPARRRRRHRTSAARSSPTTTPTGTSTPC